MLSRHYLVSTYSQWSESRARASAPSVVALCVALLAVLWIGNAQAAQEGANETRISIGIGAAKPGDSIRIPITLFGGEQGQVRSVNIHVSFPKALLTFTEAEPGLSVELAEGEVKATLGNDSDDSSRSSLELVATGKSPINPGVLAYMKFRVSTDTPKGEITLKLKDYKATAPQGGPMQLAQGNDGLLTIYALNEVIPLIGCFFFAH